MGMIRPGRLVLKVTKDYGFDDSEHSIVRRFFYETFSRCVNGSVFEGLKMDFVSYTLNLVQSINTDEQLTGARVLLLLLQSRFELKTLRTISTKQGVAEMLIEMLTWKSPHEKEIRVAAANIVSKLVRSEPNGIWVRAVTRSMDSVASLLYDSNEIERHSRRYGAKAYDYSFFSSLGLRILKILAKDHVNCTKIGRNRGLIRKVIAIAELTLDPLNWQISADLKILAIDTLTSLAREQKELLESIGSKGVVLHNLLSLFFMERNNYSHSKEELSAKAGEALSILSLENKQNCEIMMSIKLGNDPNMIASLISMLNINPVKFLHVARILRNLLVYADAELVELTEITKTAPQVVDFVMSTRHARQEAAIGLAVQIFKVMTVSDFYRVFGEQGREINRSLTNKLLNVLREHILPSKKLPGIRRFSVELLFFLAKMDTPEIGKRSCLEEALEKISQKISKSKSSSAVRLSTGELNVFDLLEDIALSGKVDY